MAAPPKVMSVKVHQQMMAEEAARYKEAQGRIAELESANATLREKLAAEIEQSVDKVDADEANRLRDLLRNYSVEIDTKLVRITELEMQKRQLLRLP